MPWLQEVDAESFFSTTAGQATIILGAIVFAVVIIATLTRVRQDEPDAILLDFDEETSS